MTRPAPFLHPNATAPDEQLAAEMADFIAKSPTRRFMAWLLTTLHEMTLPWWTPQQRREKYSATARMRLLFQRADLRESVMSRLGSMPPKTARRLEPEQLAQLLDEYLKEDIAVEDFEIAFPAEIFVAYGDVTSLFNEFLAAMPWENPSSLDKQFLANAIAALVDCTVLTHWQIRFEGIDLFVWQNSVPLKLRVEVDRRRFEFERNQPSRPFTARDEFGIVTPDLLVQSIPLVQLRPIFERAAREMHFRVEAEEPIVPSRILPPVAPPPLMPPAKNDDPFGEDS